MATYQQSGNSSPQTSRAVLATIGAQVRGFFDQAASLTTSLTGTNNDLTYTSVAKSSGANSVRVRYVVAGASTALSVSVSTNDITVNVATDSGSAATSTAAQVAAAVTASTAAAALVTVANAPGNDGTGVVTALAFTALAGGTDSTRGTPSGAPLPTQHPIHDSYS